MNSRLSFIISPFVGFRFYFDFDDETIEMMNPQHCGKRIFGLTCTQPGNECIYIGARLLLDEELKLTVHGTLAHEMLHQAIIMRYRNDCKPYEKGDEARAKEYREVVRETNFKYVLDDLFERALRNPGGQDAKEIELIVRPAHAEVLYVNDEVKRQRLERNYNELYDFYRNRVLPDIDQALKEAHEKAKKLQEKYNVPMDADDVEYFENIRKLKRKQLMLWIGSILTLLVVCGAGCFFYFWKTPMNQIKTINGEFFSGFEHIQLTNEAVQSFYLNIDAANHQVLHFKSNCAVMTVLAIYQFLAMDSSMWKSFFVNFDEVADESKGKKFRELHESLLHPTMIVNCSGVNATRLLNFLGGFNTERIILVSESFKNFDNWTSIELNHSWSQLTNPTQLRILERSIVFQGIYVALRKILRKKPIESAIDSDDILRRIVTSDKIKIRIGTKLVKLKVYVNRTLMIYTAERFSFDEFYNLNQKTQVLLLSDLPGNGKSTEMKMIAWRLKQKDPSRWVLYFDLKKFTKSFESMRSLETSADVARFIGQGMLNFDEFEVENFLEQF
jgi:hypothetical protein